MSAQGDCEFLVQRARELVPQDLWAAKAWLITARSLYPADFNIQVRPGGRAEGAAPTALRPPASPPSPRSEPGDSGSGRPGRGHGSVSRLRPGPRRVPRGKGRPRGGGGMGVSWVPARGADHRSPPGWWLCKGGSAAHRRRA